jgi:NAD(P)-dependent dehydrogenase (short-subunit alcohol dehydrogenase family)
MNSKTILITGGTTGIGLATAQLLSAQGAKVIVTGRNPETLASAKKTLEGVVVLPSDSGDLAAALALGDEIKTLADHLDGAFLNAGIATFVPFEAATPKNYDDTFNVNVRGLYKGNLPTVPNFLELFLDKSVPTIPTAVHHHDPHSALSRDQAIGARWTLSCPTPDLVGLSPYS